MFATRIPLRCLSLTAFVALCSFSPAAPAAAAAETDHRPPERTLARIRQLHHLSDELAEEIWPGFDTRKIPIAVNIDDRREILIGHPDPPPEFHPFGDVTLDGQPVLIRDGVTRYGPSGGGWAIELGGVRAVYVGILDEQGERDTEGYLSLLLHEAFHCYQVQYREPAEGPTDEYPLDDPVYAALLVLESHVLKAAVEAEDGDEARRLAAMFAAVRHQRRRELSPGVILREGEDEYNEGTATYSQARMFQLLAARGGLAPLSDLRDPRYHGFADAEQRYRENVAKIIPEGDGSVTFMHAMYQHGMAQGLLLDRLRPGWKEELREQGMTQFTVLERELALSPEEEEKLLALARERFAYGDLLAEQKRRVGERLATIRGFIAAPGRRYQIYHEHIPGRFKWKPRGPSYQVPESLAREVAPEAEDPYALRRIVWAGGMARFEKEGLSFQSGEVPVSFGFRFLEWIDPDPAPDSSDLVIVAERQEEDLYFGLKLTTDDFSLEADRAQIEWSPEVVAIHPLPSAPPGEPYIERYLAFYPTRATAAGRTDRDGELEGLSGDRRARWVAYNERTAATLRRGLPALQAAERLDAELLLRQVERELLVYRTLRRPERDPLFWTEVIGNATIFLLVREERPVGERLTSAAARARQLPRLAAEAQEALGLADPTRIAPEHCRIAADLVRGSAHFYGAGFARAAPAGELRALLEAAGEEARAALEELAVFLDQLAARASGAPRLGEHYPELFRLVTGTAEPLPAVLARAEAELSAYRRETADYGRELWPEIFPERPAPAADAALIRALFDRLSEDRAASNEQFIAQYRRLVAEAIDFVRERRLITLPPTLPVHVDRSPAYLVGQSVGGVYPPGPWAPDAATLLFLPTPPDDAGEQAREALFRDFNDHFNRMITPHEIVPGHALQLVLAARHPRRVRTLFPDDVYVEGWGTFCERLLLDQGWGGSLARLAHRKKRLENIARLIVDIRVHTAGMTRDEVLDFVREQAFQDEQFAVNMWRRTITSAPQLTTYYLGFEQVWGLYEEVRAARGSSFDLRTFLDGMMELGPVPVKHYRERMVVDCSGKKTATP
ncbi:MAG: DUF885 domain-containing protein [bacterium]|nr:DUF885 domain-containing protein [bacterium]